MQNKVFFCYADVTFQFSLSAFTGSFLEDNLVLCWFYYLNAPGCGCGEWKSLISSVNCLSQPVFGRKIIEGTQSNELSFSNKTRKQNSVVKASSVRHQNLLEIHNKTSVKNLTL